MMTFMMASLPAQTVMVSSPVAEPTTPEALTIERASLYVPRILQQHLVDAPNDRCWTALGTAVLIDISGFTSLSERLARKGREGAEQITDAIGKSFESILLVAYDNGGSLLKFGGDAMLLWFEGDRHASRACRATVLMRRVLRDAGRIELPDAKVTLRMSQGVHTGNFHFFAVGHSHVELMPCGPAWSRLVEIQKAALGGEILISADTAALVPRRCLGETKSPGVLLRGEPTGIKKLPHIERPKMSADMLAHCLSPSIRAHVLGGGGTSEHRPVTIAFIRFEGVDALIEQQGPDAAGEALHQLVDIVQTAAIEQQITFLASDIDADGGKLILTAGAPRVIGDDEERMLLALRAVLSKIPSLPVRVGIHRGAVFAGDIGPFYRRTYTVMGDAVNLAARLMGEAKHGEIYTTADVLARSNTLFETEEIPPFHVKGKAQPIRAWSVRGAKGSRTRHLSLQQLPLVGHSAELNVMREALSGARANSGRLIEFVGESGVGKTRLLEALRKGATDFRQMHGVCEAYTTSKPYAIWSELLREFMSFGRDDADATIADRLRAEVTVRAPELVPWFPLIAIVFGVEAPPTPEVELLAEGNRRAKLNEVVGRFLRVLLPDPTLIEIEDAHHMDLASGELLASLARELADCPWVFGVARRPTTGFTAPTIPTVTRIEVTPLGPSDILLIAQLQAEQHPLPLHVLKALAHRSGGNPQFLLDLFQAAIRSGTEGGLPDSAEAAAIARIDGLDPEDRALVRRASVFGLTFHPRMLSWLYDAVGETVPGSAAWQRVQELFDEEPDGYLRFRRSLLRDAAYEGLPYKLRRRLHGTVAAHLEEEMDDPEDAADILSTHYLEAGAYPLAWRYAGVAGKRAQGVYAYVEAAKLYSRAIEAGSLIGNVADSEMAAMHEARANCWYRLAEYEKASKGYSTAYRLVKGDRIAQSNMLLMRSWIEEKLGNYSRSLRWAGRARKAVGGLTDPAAARQAARATSWCAMVLQTKGRTNDALRWAQRAMTEAEAADDPEALGEAHNVIGWALRVLGKEGAQEHFQRSLEAYERSGNLFRQAGLLSNMGTVCHVEGRWDEALVYYERGRDGLLKIGETVPAGVARINIAELLIDRGQLAEAERLLLETVQVWRASHYRFFLGVSLLLLGRAALRGGRCDEALKRFNEAKTNFAEVGAEEEIPAVDACIAECRIFMDDTDAALELADAMLRRAGSSNGVARVVPLLKRVRAHALLERGDSAAARQELYASLAAARHGRDLFEITRTLLSLVYVHRLEGVEPPPAIVAESNSMLAKLSIRVVPPVPAPMRAKLAH